MKIYLVGGAVRDTLLGIPNKDQDWLVVGATPAQMLAQGYQQVGADFPVFLHPTTKQEYALARTERKSGLGYQGFVCDFSDKITLEEDLARRDLTINAIAQDDTGTLYAPHGGLADLQNKILRHVSPAFCEDPLRILRVARFAASLHELGFRIAPETLTLLKKMVQNGELSHLCPERVWQEWQRSLCTARPDIFLQTLHECGALAVVIPEIAKLFGIPQPKKWHPEIDTGLHTLLVAQKVAQICDDPVVRFAAQLHDLGKGLTDKENWPSHKLHEQLGEQPIKAVCQRLRVPNSYRDCALMVCAHHTFVHHANEKSAPEFIALFDACDFWRKPERLLQLTQACQADSQGRTGCEEAPYPQAALLTDVFAAASTVQVA
ncbi:MAG: multifunctional CCA addition/repair protein, partial [Enterovibrio sp.]